MSPSHKKIQILLPDLGRRHGYIVSSNIRKDDWSDLKTYLMVLTDNLIPARISI